MAYKSAEEYNHALWLGYVQPVGLVVSATALVDAGAHLDTNYLPRHQSFLAAMAQANDFPDFAGGFFKWSPEAITGGEAFDLHLPEFSETLSASFAVRDLYADGRPALLLAKQLVRGAPFDKVPETANTREWQATPQAKFERLLRESGVPAGILLNGDSVRLVYAPRGESSGHITFHFADMEQVAGRPLASALHMLLSAERLFSLPEKERLPAILVNSRKFQNQVSTQLSGQILAALYELLRGFQAAHAQSGGTLLAGALAHDPNHIYQGLLTVLLRLVFLLFAEDRGLLSADSVYINYYSLSGLFERLRRDHAHYPDTMGARYGGWAQLLTLFRLIYAGGRHGGFQIPARRGYLFDPERYPFWKAAAKICLAYPTECCSMCSRTFSFWMENGSATAIWM